MEQEHDSKRQIEALHLKIDRLTRQVEQLARFIETSPASRTLPVDRNIGMVRLNGGQLMLVDMRDTGVGRAVMARGMWEADNTSMMQTLVKPGTICFDVGANYGYFALVMAAATGADGRVFAFEPNPHVLPLLQQTLRMNGLAQRGIVKAFGTAAGAASGSAELYFRPGDYGGGSLHFSDGFKRSAGLDKATVDVDALDRFLPEIPTGRPVFMKLDVEGGEHQALQGARAIIRASAAVTIMAEFTPLFIKREMPVADYVDALLGFGLTTHEAADGRLVPLDRDVLVNGGNRTLFLTKAPAA